MSKACLLTSGVWLMIITFQRKNRKVVVGKKFQHNHSWAIITIWIGYNYWEGYRQQVNTLTTTIWANLHIILRGSRTHFGRFNLSQCLCTFIKRIPTGHWDWYNWSCLDTWQGNSSRFLGCSGRMNKMLSKSDNLNNHD